MKKLIFISFMLFVYNFAFSGQVIDVVGDVSIMVGDKWETAIVGMEVPDGTKIMTGMDSSITVSITGGIFAVKELSMVMFEEKDTGKGTENKVTMKIGKVRTNFKKGDSINSSLKIQTPVGTASIRGTEKEITYFPTDGMNVYVITGLVDIIDPTGSYITIIPGEEGKIVLHGDIKSQIKRWLEEGELKKFITEVVVENPDKLAEALGDEWLQGAPIDIPYEGPFIPVPSLGDDPQLL